MLRTAGHFVKDGVCPGEKRTVPNQEDAGHEGLEQICAFER